MCPNSPTQLATSVSSVRLSHLGLPHYLREKEPLSRCFPCQERERPYKEDTLSCCHLC